VNNGVRIIRILEYTYRDPLHAATDQLRWLTGISNENVTIRSAHLAWEFIEWEQPNAKALDGPFPGHRQNCHVWKHHPRDYEMGNPDSEQHCMSCHCSCDPEGPTCGHTAGGPGC
jgi:hypothetical protein